MSPFSNGTEGDMFQANRCQRCVHYDHEIDFPCEEFDPALLGNWPEIFYRVPISAANPLGIECRKFEAVAW
jgi:hypothetical protein